MAVKSIARASIVVICLSLCMAGFGGLSLAKANSSSVDELVKQVNVLQEQLQLLVGTNSVGILTSGGCINNNTSYQNNAVVQSLTLNNRISTSLKGYQYRCTSGRWIMEKITGTNTAGSGAMMGTNTPSTGSSSSSTVQSCVSGTESFPEGTSRTSITVNGKTSSISDAKYVCRSGVWKIEGGLPSSKKIGGKCVALGETYRPGAETSKMFILTNEERKNLDVLMASISKRIVCQDGKWVEVQKAARSTCKLKNERDVNHGTVSASPMLFGARPGLYTCINGEWIKDAKTCTYNGKTLTHGDIVQVSTTTKAVGSAVPVATTVNMICKNGQLVNK